MVRLALFASLALIPACTAQTSDPSSEPSADTAATAPAEGNATPYSSCIPKSYSRCLPTPQCNDTCILPQVWSTSQTTANDLWSENGSTSPDKIHMVYSMGGDTYPSGTSTYYFFVTGDNSGSHFWKWVEVMHPDEAAFHTALTQVERNVIANQAALDIASWAVSSIAPSDDTTYIPKKGPPHGFPTGLPYSWIVNMETTTQSFRTTVYGSGTGSFLGQYRSYAGL